MKPARFGILVRSDFTTTATPEQLETVRLLARRVSTLFNGIECTPEVIEGSAANLGKAFGRFIVSMPIPDFVHGEQFEQGPNIAARIREDPECTELLRNLTDLVAPRGRVLFMPLIPDKPVPSPV